MSNPNGQPRKATCLRGHDTSKPEARGHSGVCLACQAEKMRERRASDSESAKRTNAIVAKYQPKMDRPGSVAEMDAREERRIARIEAREAARNERKGLSDAR